MRRRDCLRMATAGSMSMLGLTGCLALLEGDDTESTDTRTTTPSDQVSSVPSTENKREVPTVTNPLDVSTLKANVCSALSSDQLQKLSLKSGERDSGSSGPTCEYEYIKNSSSQIAIQITNPFKNGLADIYAKEEALGYFEEIEIAGYPAVIAYPYGEKNVGYHQHYVGLTDTFVVRVIVQLSRYTGDYGLSRDIAGIGTKAMIQNLKGETTDLTLPSTIRTKSKREVPTVSNPLDVSALKTDPCTALSSDQLQKLNLLHDEHGSTPLTDYCNYEYAGKSYSNVTIAVLKRFENGLADIYAREKEFNYFEPTQISGYPAVYAIPSFSKVINSKESMCRLYIGLTDDFVVVLFTTLYDDTSDYGRPCDVVKLTGETMIQNLKGGS